MKVEKFKVLLYLKKSGLDKSVKAPIMGRITVNRTMAQFSSKLSCTPELWNPCESRLNGKSKEAVEINAKIDNLLLAINSAFDSLLERKQEFDATDVKNVFQGSKDTQITLLNLFDRHIEEIRARVGIDVSHRTLPTYLYTRRRLEEFISKRFKINDVAFCQLNEQFIREYQEYIIIERGLAVETVRHYLAILKKICRIAFKEGHADKYHFEHYPLPKQKATTPRALSKEDFEKLRDLEIEEHRWSHHTSRDMFLFACYTGTAYIDVTSITNDNLSTDDSGAMWLKYRRGKNGKLCRVKLLPEAIEKDAMTEMMSPSVSPSAARDAEVKKSVELALQDYTSKNGIADTVIDEEAVAEPQSVMDVSIITEEPPTIQCRVSSKQRKLSLEEYRNVYLKVPTIIDRKPVFVSCEVRDRLEDYVRKLGGRKMSVSGLLENIARQHLDTYDADFEQWRKL